VFGVMARRLCEVMGAGGSETVCRLSAAHPCLAPRAGHGITNELSRNHEILFRIHSKAGDVSGTLDEARRILRSMGRREVRTKVVVGVFAVLIIAIIIGLIVWVAKKDQPQ
jgi:hypothetical protein